VCAVPGPQQTHLSRLALCFALLFSPMLTSFHFTMCILSVVPPFSRDVRCALLKENDHQLSYTEEREGDVRKEK
jgi:hypothetical protein